MLGLRFCARAFSSCGKRGPLFIAVRGPLTITASLVAEHRLQTRRLSSCGSQAQLLHGMWDLPRPGLEPVFPALAGGFSTTAPPGKPKRTGFDIVSFYQVCFCGYQCSLLVAALLIFISLFFSQMFYHFFTDSSKPSYAERWCHGLGDEETFPLSKTPVFRR